MPTFEDCKELFPKFNKELLQKQLHEGVVTVRFTKVDGNVRDMVCTLNPSLLPLVSRPATNSTPAVPLIPQKSPNANVCVVFDTEKQAWRSFRYDSVLSTSLDWTSKV